MSLGTGTANGLTTPPDVATFSTLSSLLASPPAGRATALDAPGSMLFEVDGKWGGDPGVFTSTTDPNYIAYMAAISAGTVFPAPSILIGATAATAVAMEWNGLGYSIDGFPTFASATERNAAYASVLPGYVGFPAYLPGGVRTEWVGPTNADWRIANTLPAIFPSARTGEAIQIAIDSAALMGGGRVVLDAATYAVAEPIVLRSHVWLEGVFGGPTQVTDGGTILDGGTRLFDGLVANHEDLGAMPTNTQVHAIELKNIKVANITFKRFASAIRIGGINNPGATHSRFVNLYAQDCSGMATFFDNIGYSFFENIVSRNCGHAHYFGASVGTAYNYGNNNYTRIFSEMPNYGRKSRGVSFIARNSSKYNDLNVHDVQHNANGARLTQAATMVSGNPSISVQKGSDYEVGMPVSVTESANGFKKGQIYFIASISGNAVTLSDLYGYGPVRTPTGSLAVSLVDYGYPSLVVAGIDAASEIQPSCFLAVDVEAKATTDVLCQNAWLIMNCEVIYGAQDVTCAVNACFRGNSRVQFNSTRPLSFDIDDGSASYCSWYGGTMADADINKNFLPNRAPFGIYRSNKFSSPVLSLGFSGGADYFGSLVGVRAPSDKQGLLYPRQSMGQRVSYSASAALTLNGDHFGNICATITQTAAWTLPTLGAVSDPGSPYKFWGATLEVCNISNYALTLNTGAGELINRTSGRTSLSVPAGASIVLRASHDGATPFWLIVSNNGAS